MEQRNQTGRRVICWVMIAALEQGSIAPLLADPLPTGFTPVHAGAGSSYKVEGKTGTIVQTLGKEVYRWSSFDIDNGYKVVFKQPQNGVALNRIGGTAPSQIRGQLQANGTIYLINPNGIVFGSTAQVNVGALVASALDIDDQLFLNSSIAEAINKNLPAFSCDPLCADLVEVEINIEQGAKIRSEDAGGVMVFAPKINNAGTIETPDGQALLAASKNKVYLTPATPSGSSNPMLRGFLVEVDTGGEVNNIGSIIAERGNITLLGAAVNQNGRLTATTAVDRNGSIRLLARDGANVRTTANSIGANTDAAALARGPLIETLASPNVAVATRTGTVTFGENSVTEVTPDTGSKAAPDALAQLPSVVETMGRTVNFADNASVVAHGGKVQVVATTRPDAPGQSAGTGAAINLGRNVTIDVSGTRDTVRAMQDSVVKVKLVGTELADSPEQRDGVLSRAEVNVDIEAGTEVADISGAVQNVNRGINERLSAGGSVKLVSEDSVSIDPSAKIDISGGKVAYATGNKTTTYVRANGRWTEISQADPNMTYDAVQDRTREVNGYEVGKNAGSLEIVANQAPALGADVIKAGVTVGRNQLDPAKAPKAGSFTLTLNKFPDAANPDVSVVSAASYDGSAGQISDALFARSGLRTFTLNTGGDVEFAAGSVVQLADGGALSVSANGMVAPVTVNLNGTIQIAGGNVTAAAGSAPTQQQKSTLRLGEQARIDTRGRWVNEKTDPNAGLVRTIKGGDVQLTAQGDLLLAQGAVIDTSGGAYQNASGKVSAGAGGNISLNADFVRSGMSLDNTARLQLGAQLRSYSLDKGGKLSITGNGFVIDGAGTVDPAASSRITELGSEFFRSGGFSGFALTSTIDGITVAAGTVVAPGADNWVYDARLLRQRSGVDMAPFMRTTRLADELRKPVDISLSVKRPGNGLPDPQLRIEQGAVIQAEAGAKVQLKSETQLLVDGSIFAPGGLIDLLLSSGDTGFNPSQALVIGSNAELNVDATFVRVPVVGRPDWRSYKKYDAGQINVVAQNGYVLAEEGSSLSANGAARTIDRIATDSFGRTRSIALADAANAGGIRLQAAEGILFEGDLSAKAAAVEGAAGGRLEVVLDTNTAGDQRLGSAIDQAQASTIRVVQEDIAVLPANLVQRNADGQLSGVGNIRARLGAPDSAIANNSAVVSADKIESGGFDQLALTATNTKSITNNNNAQQVGRIRFDGDVDLALRQNVELNSNSLVVANDADAHVSAAYLSWGEASDSPHQRDIALPVQNGSGTLTLAGGFVDLIGKLTTSGVGDLRIASSGDLRARGVLDASQGNFIAGSLTTYNKMTLQADQVYPPTLHKFKFEVAGNPDGVLTILQDPGNQAPVLSAGGALEFKAPVIEQRGTVKAPLGSIEFNAGRSLVLADGSLTSVSLDSAMVPFGRIDQGNTWIYPLLGKNLVFSLNPKAANGEILLPQKTIKLNSPSETVAEGAVLDLSGGGDIYAFEFIPGPGGSKDILSSANAGSSFAIVPTLGLAYSPFDELDATAGSIQLGQTLSLYRDGAWRTYAVLPARYAMLPGAELVTPMPEYAAVAPGSQVQRADGAPVYAGKIGVAGAGIVGSNWSAYAIQSRAEVLQRSEYKIRMASEFFAGSDSTARTPKDAGSLQILAQGDLSLAGTLRALGADGGRGGELDIQANRIAVVSERTGASGGVELLESQLNNLAVESLLLGGARLRTDGATQVQVNADTISIAAGIELNLPELLLVAKDSVNIGDNARLTTSGTPAATTREEKIRVSGESAVVRVSAVNQADIERTSVPASPLRGTVNLAASAQLNSTNVAIDVSRGAVLAGSIETNGGSLALSAPQISISDNGSGAGLLLASQQLAGTGAKALILKGGDTIDFYTGLTLAADDLRLSADAVRGFTGAGETVTLQAGNTLTLTGTGANASGGSASGGALQLAAKQIVLSGKNDTASSLLLTGFNNVALQAHNAIVARGDLQLGTPAAVNLNTPLIKSENGANLALTTAAALIASGGTGAAAEGGYGGSVALTGNIVNVDTDVLLGGGQFLVRATSGDVVLGDHARIDTAGRVLKVGDQELAMGGGSVLLRADQGDVQMAQSASIDVSGSAKGGAAGSLTAQAPQGQLNLAGQLKATAAPGYLGGKIAMDAQGVNAWSELLARIGSGGFNGAVSLRQRSGDIVLGAGDTVRARTIEFSADQGDISVAGRLDANGVEAGSIKLAAGQDLQIAGSAQLSARAFSTAEAIAAGYKADAINANQRGGQVGLSARDGFATLANGAHIDVSARGNGKGGEVHLRVPRTQNGVVVSAGQIGNGAAVAQLGATIDGASRVDIEAVQHYDASYLSDADKDPGGLLDVIKTQTQQFMNDAAGWLATIGAPQLARLLPGVELRSSGDLVVDTKFDLADWRYGTDADGDGRGDTPGVLTLRAADNIQIVQSVSDGFVPGFVPPPGEEIFCGIFYNCDPTLGSGASWSLNVVAGADNGAARVDAVIEGRGDVQLASGALLRTGTGDIAIAAGRNLVLDDLTAGIYTAGSATPLQDANGNGYTEEILEIFLPGSLQYPIDGGDVAIFAGNDVRVDNTSTPALAMDWLQRIGDSSKPATWGIVFEKFGGGAATLGGGDISVRAGRDITRFGVFAPTTGKQVGEFTFDPASLQFTMVSSLVDVQGGGDVAVTAGRDIASSSFLVSRGRGTIEAGRDIAQAGDVASMIGIGDAQVNVTAGSSVVLETVYNPTLALQSAAQNVLGVERPDQSYFSTYTQRSAISLLARTGKVQLKNDEQNIIDSYANLAWLQSAQGGASQPLRNAVADFFRIFPATVSAVAALGDIELNNNLVLAPAASGHLQLVAGRDIVAAGSAELVRVHMADGDPAALPQVAAADPVTGLSAISAGGEPSAVDLLLTRVRQVLGLDKGADNHALTPLHQNDAAPAQVAAGGDIRNDAKRFVFDLAKSLRAFAGGDVLNTSFLVQNVRESDVSRIQAGGDIAFIAPRSDKGFSAARDGNTEIRISGPGRLDLLAGGDIDLGNALGLRSLGDLENSALPDLGATIGLFAGLGEQGLDYDAFFDAYLKDSAALLLYVMSERFAGELNAYVTAVTGVQYADRAAAIDALADLTWGHGEPELNQALAIASAAFKNAGRDAQRELVMNGFYREIREGGISAITGKGEGYTRSYRAIDTLFGDADSYAGNIRLVQSGVQINDGGDVNLLAPGGQIDVGLPAAGSADPKLPQGIVVSQTGSIAGYTLGDVNVNRSKIIAQDGGDILLFSRQGGIDAGRGARTALVLPPPVVFFDEQGNLRVASPPAVSGSGIQAGCSSPGCVDGTAYLFAPNGFVDAGDAGIKAKTAFIGADVVRNTDAIDVANAFGVPVATVDSGLGALGDVAATATQAATDAASDNASGKDNASGFGERQLALLTIDILSYETSDGTPAFQPKSKTESDPSE